MQHWAEFAEAALENMEVWLEIAKVDLADNHLQEEQLQIVKEHLDLALASKDKAWGEVLELKLKLLQEWLGRWKRRTTICIEQAILGELPEQQTGGTLVI